MTGKCARFRNTFVSAAKLRPRHSPIVPVKQDEALLNCRGMSSLRSRLILKISGLSWREQLSRPVGNVIVPFQTHDRVQRTLVLDRQAECATPSSPGIGLPRGLHFGAASSHKSPPESAEAEEDYQGHESLLIDQDAEAGVHEVSGFVDVTYRSPTERVWPAEKHQRKFGAKVQRALASLLSGRRDSSLQSLLNMGFTIEEVRMSPDNMIAYVLWSCLPDHEERAERTLRHSAGRMRGSLAHALQVRRVPRLEFRLNKLNAQQQQMEDILQQLDKEG